MEKWSQIYFVNANLQKLLACFSYLASVTGLPCVKLGHINLVEYCHDVQ